jgi:hypothetical protein
MRNSINQVSVINDIAAAIVHHSNLVNYYANVVKTEPDFYKSNLARTWSEVDMHVIDQMWGSTACGWGGMGGSAMTNKHNVILEHPREKILFVYWDGKLAYILDNKEDFFSFNRMPSRDSETKQLLYMPPR